MEKHEKITRGKSKWIKIVCMFFDLQMKNKARKIRRMKKKKKKKKTKRTRECPSIFILYYLLSFQ
jgi:hypothetical protein